MKQIHITLLTLILVLLGGVSTARGATEDGYHVDFNTPIDTKAHNFKVAQNWGHIVDSYYDEDNFETYYMNYSWSATSGETDGALLIPEQRASDGYAYGGIVYDMLITPEVSGTVCFKVKPYIKSYNTYLEIYSLNADGTKHDKLLHKFSNDDMGTGSEWVTLTFDVPQGQRLCLRGSKIYLDDFLAESAEITPEPGLTVMSVDPAQSTGVIIFNQQADGKVHLKYNVTVKNSGQIDFTPGMENYSVSIVKGDNNVPIDTIQVPVALAAGATSEPFEVSTAVNPKDIWSWSGSMVTISIKENITNTVMKSGSTQYKEFTPKFILRKKDTTPSSSNVNSVDFGITSQSETMECEIFNGGNAPLTIKSVTAPAGFTCAVPTGEFTVEPDSIVPISITLPGDRIAAYADTLKIVYIQDLSGKEATKTVPVSGKCSAGKWFTTFTENNRFAYPQGSVAEGGITNDDSYVSGTQNHFLKSNTSNDFANGNNKFITPKLHAVAGEKVYFDVARDSKAKKSNGFVQVYVSKDRKNWGEPLKSFAYPEFTDDSFKSDFIEIAETGDCYIGFAVFGMKLDDIMGLEKVPVTQDLYILTSEQNEQIQGGDELEPKVTVIPITGLDKDSYTVKYVVDGKATTLTSVTVSANSKSTTQFKHKFIPECDSTSVIKGHFEFEFTDGAKFVSDEMSTRVLVEPVFVFFKKGTTASNWNKPNSEKTPLDYGKTNKKLTKEYEIYNWGAAPLKVKSIRLPEGFAAKDNDGNVVDTCTVESKARQAVNIEFFNETPGNYEGNIAITFETPEGNDSTYTLPLKGKMLDPNKYYNSFGFDQSKVTFVPGTLIQKNVSTANNGYPAYDWHMYVISGPAETNRMFITPKLKAEAGEEFMFDAKYKDYTSAEIKVYASATREGLAADSTRQLLMALDGRNESDSLKLTDVFRTFSTVIPEAGEYYIGIDMANKAYVDDVYGLSVVPVDYDLSIASSNIPATGMQNVAVPASLKVNNFGLADVAADEYQIKVYVNGEASVTGNTIDLPMEHNAFAEGKEIGFSFQSPKVGTFPVYAEITAGDKTWKTEPVDVTFSEEVLNSEVTVGTPSSSQNNKDVPVNLWYLNSETIALYTPDMLGLSDGAMINQIIYKGYSSGSKSLTGKLSVYYKWVDETTLTQPTTNTEYDVTDMTALRAESDYTYPTGGKSTEMIDIITIQLTEPIQYHAGKSLMILTRNSMTDSENNHYFEISTTKKKQCYSHRDDKKTTPFFTGSWSEYALPVLHLGLVAEARTVSGKVLNAAGEAVSGAVVNLTSADDANVQYEATTAADGTYTVNVIQSARSYNLHAYAENVGEEFIDAVSVADESKALDLTLRPIVVITDDATHAAVEGEAVVYLNKVLTAGFNTLTLPFALDDEEMTALFGTEATVYKFKNDDGGLTPAARFEKVTAMEAGQPYLVALTADTEPVVFRRKAIAAELATVNGTALQFVPTSARTPLTEGMFLLTEDMVKPSKIRALEGETSIPAFSAYLKATNPSVTNVTLLLDVVPTGVDGIDTDNSANDVIYNLNGFRVKKANKGGIYIINGEKVIVM